MPLTRLHAVLDYGDLVGQEAELLASFKKRLSLGIRLFARFYLGNEAFAYIHPPVHERIRRLKEISAKA